MASTIVRTTPAQPSTQLPVADGFPRAELVALSASETLWGRRSWEGVLGARRGDEDIRRYNVIVSPGAVQLVVTDPTRRERRADNLAYALPLPIDRPRLDFHADPDRVGELVALNELDGRGRLAIRKPSAKGRDALGGVRLTRAVIGEDVVQSCDTYELLGGRKRVLTDRLRVVPLEPRPTRVIEQWSGKSRRRMVLTLASLDWWPVVGTADRPAMTTLTYPGRWLECAPTGRVSKRHLELFFKRYARAWGAEWQGAWKLEFQGRGAAHYHLFSAPPSGRSACTCRKLHAVVPVTRLPRAVVLAADPKACLGGLDYPRWLSAAWAASVDAPDPAERVRHHLAGTGVDYAEGERARDPKRLAVYFAGFSLGHSMKSRDGKEYQHRVPEEWSIAGRGPGRFWGYRQMEKVTATVGLDLPEFYAARRLLRRWERAKGRVRTVRVWRSTVDVGTGEIRYRPREVRRRSGVMGQSGLSGGFVTVNNGPGMAESMSVALRPHGQRGRFGAGAYDLTDEQAVRLMELRTDRVDSDTRSRKCALFCLLRPLAVE